MKAVNEEKERRKLEQQRHQSQHMETVLGSEDYSKLLGGSCIQFDDDESGVVIKNQTGAMNSFHQTRFIKDNNKSIEDSDIMFHFDSSRMK
jgi:hypothetical protein